MKNYRLRHKILIVVFISTLITGTVIGISTRIIFNEKLLKEVQSRLSANLALISGAIDRNSLKMLFALLKTSETKNFKDTVVSSPSFQMLTGQLRNFMQSEKKLYRYIYILVPGKEPNNPKFLIDVSAGGEKTSSFGENYDISPFPSLIQAMEQRKIVIEDKLYFDKEFNIWSLSGYAPLFDENENFLGIIGIDLEQSSLNRVIYDTLVRFIVICIIAFMISVGASYIMTGIITKPLDELQGAVNAFAASDFSARAPILTTDEIGKLSGNFNRMADFVQQYNENLEELVARRTEELAGANRELAEKNRIMKNELHMARKVQQAMIPRIFPSSIGVSLDGTIFPMEDLGGDLYDVFPISATKLGIVVLDVCGHGVQAALITTMAKVLFTINSKEGLSTGEILTRVNREIYPTTGEIYSYFTAFYCIIDMKMKTMEYTNAGHNEIYVIGRKGDMQSLKMNSIFVGLKADYTYASETVPIQAGDRIVFYTDGVIEAMNMNNEFFGKERFIQIIKDKKHSDSRDLLHAVLEEIEDFRGLRSINDDITILIADIRQAAEGEMAVNIKTSESAVI